MIPYGACPFFRGPCPPPSPTFAGLEWLALSALAWLWLLYVCGLGRGR